MTPELFSPQELAEIHAYHDPAYVAGALQSVLYPVTLLLVARFGTRPLHAWSTRVAASRFLARAFAAPVLRTIPRVALIAWNGPGLGAAVVFAIALFLGLQLIDLPVDVYFGFVREHEFGMSNQSFGSYVWDLTKGTLVTLWAVSMLTIGIYGLSRRLKHWWWILGLVCAVVLTASTMIDPYRNRLYVEQTPLPEGELRTRITGLMKSAGIDFEDVLIERTSEKSVRLDAYFAGEGPTRTIVLADTLITTLTPDEVLAAVGHEAGHVHESRTLNRIGAALTMFAFLGLIEWLFRVSARRQWLGITERADIRTLPLVLLMFAVAASIATPVSAAYSRQHEREADAFSMKLQNSSEAFESMLRKAARLNKSDPYPPKWHTWLGSTHPPMGERIDAAQAWQKKTAGDSL